MNSTQPPLSASSIAKMKLMAADHELSQALVKVVLLVYYIAARKISWKQNVMLIKFLHPNFASIAIQSCFIASLGRPT